MFIRTGVHHWLNTDHLAQITWYHEEHEFIVKWTTGLSITVSEEQGVRALEQLTGSEPHDVPPNRTTSDGIRHARVEHISGDAPHVRTAAIGTAVE